MLLSLLFNSILVVLSERLLEVALEVVTDSFQDSIYVKLSEINSNILLKLPSMLGNDTLSYISSILNYFKLKLASEPLFLP